MVVCNALCSFMGNFLLHVYALPVVRLAFVTLTNKAAVTYVVTAAAEGTTLQERYS